MKKDSQERLQELLTWRAVEQLSAAQERELEGLLEAHPEWEDESFELAAAALEVALDHESEPLPVSLRSKLSEDAAEFFSTSRQADRKMRLVKPSAKDKQEAPPPSGQLTRWAGWMAAAALLVVSLMSWLPSLQGPASLEEARQKLLRRDSGALLLDWQATDDPAAQGASGDVLWSGSTQNGFLRIRGLAANNPTRLQYQLWIFDRNRDDRYPVDGGVFDIPVGADEVIVPIQASLPVGQAHLFAVTVEQPGGVVVSSRDRIVLLANSESSG